MSITSCFLSRAWRGYLQTGRTFLIRPKCIGQLILISPGLDCSAILTGSGRYKMSSTLWSWA